MAKKSSRGFVADKAFVEAQTKQLVSDLAFYAGGPVAIELRGGKEIAFTTNTADKLHTIRIVMNPNVLAKFRNRDRAILVWRGIGFHELAHHLYPAEEQYKVAYKEGFGQLYNLMDDEQNERRGAARDPSWGAAFQSTVAFIFPRKDSGEKSLVAGHHHKDDGKKRNGFEALEVYRLRFNEFAFHMRRHLNGAKDPQVRRALELLPPRYKDLTKDELLDLCRAVHLTLIDGLELPKEPERKPGDQVHQHEEAEEKPAPAKEPQPEPEPASEEPPEEDLGPEPLTWRQLLTSRWTLAGVVVFALAWALLLMQAGTDLWFSVVVAGLIACTVVGGLALFSALRKRRAAIADALSGPNAAATAGMDRLARIDWKRVLTGIGLIAAVGGGIWLLAYFFGDTGIRWWMILLAPVLFLGLMLGILLLLPGGKQNVINLIPQSWTHGGNRYRRTPWQKFVGFLSDSLNFLWDKFWGLLGAIWNGIKAVGRWFISWRIWSLCWGGITWIGERIGKAWDKTTRFCIRMSRKTWVRVILLALPVALPLALLASVGAKAMELNWWIVLALLLWLLLLMLLFWFYRKQLTDYLLAGMTMDADFLHGVRFVPPLDRHTLEFNVLTEVVQTEADEAFLNTVLPEVVPLGQQLRPHMERCGAVPADLEDAYDGYDLVDDIEQAQMGRVDLFVDEQMVTRASLHIEVAVDCSSSMLSSTDTLRAGEKFDLAKRFALIVEEAIRNQRGMTGHFWGFTDTEIYDCGEPGEYRTSGLKSHGGNNDSAMLWHMGQSAARSGKEIRILLMISDGQPADCSWGSLHNLVNLFESDGMIPVQIAVDRINEPAFKTWFVDLVGQTMPEAVISMGHMLVSLVDRG